MKVSIDLPEIEGFEYTGEYRKPVIGEWFLNVEKVPTKSLTVRGSPYPILKKKESYYHSFLINEHTYIDIKSLGDALNIIEATQPEMSDEQYQLFKTLKELL